MLMFVMSTGFGQLLYVSAFLLQLHATWNQMLVPMVSYGILIDIEFSTPYHDLSARLVSDNKNTYILRTS